MYPHDIGQVSVKDMTDGQFAVDYSFYQAGEYRIAIHGIGSDGSSSSQPYDSIDALGLQGMFP